MTFVFSVQIRVMAFFKILFLVVPSHGTLQFNQMIFVVPLCLVTLKRFEASILNNNAFIYLEISCPKVPKNHNKLKVVSTDGNCFKEPSKVGDICRFECASGYQFSGSRSITCTKKTGAIGEWKTGNSQLIPPDCRGTFPDSSRTSIHFISLHKNS